MIIEKVPIDKLNPAKYNPRKDLKPGDPEYEKLRRSIREFGYVEPIIWNRRTGNVVGGHQRLKILREDGETEPTCVIVDMDDIREKALNIALNKVKGDWDKDKLADLMYELDAVDFDIELTGFENEEVADLILDTSEEKEATPKEYETDFKLGSRILKEIKESEVFLTFSGGKDSSIAAYLMIPILREIGKDFELVFIDTGVEIPSVSEYVVRFAKHFGAKLQIVRSDKEFFSYYEPKKQWPNAIYRDCIGVLIKDPAEKYMIEKAGGDKKILNIRGGRSDQATDLSKGEKIYTVKQGTRDIRLLSPLYDLSEGAFNKYKSQLETEFGLWEGYAKGFQRTACWCCPFQTVQQYDMIKKELPLCWGVLERKAKEWKFQGATHLDRYLTKPRRTKKQEKGG